MSQSERLEETLARARAGRDAALADLFELLRIPSVSVDAAYAPEVRRAARWVAERLERLGFAVEVADVGVHPVVAGEWLGRPGAPTLGLYAHYDVQPPEPLEGWTTPPFEPDVRDGFVYARGARDDKGQLVAELKALEHLFAGGGPPVNVRVFYEGEEEIAGVALATYLRENAERVPCDYALLCDGQFAAPGFPSVVTGLRGILLAEIEVVGPASDLHSGLFGGAVPNPLNVLSHVLAGLRDRDGRITIPGFYDPVRPPSEEELAGWRSLPIDEAWVLRESGARALDGEAAYSPLERLWARPTFDVNGIVGGHQREGGKTVIPSRAVAKVSLRLVPDQEPAQVLAALTARVQELAPPSVTASVRSLGASPPVTLGADNPGVRAVRRALEATFGRPSVLVRMGGSVPVTTDFQEVLDPYVISLGFGFPDDANHAPDERFSLEQFHGATETIVRLAHELADAPPRRP